MKTEIDEKIITKTTHCEMEFACLQNGANVCCKVEQYFANRYLFVNAQIANIAITKRHLKVHSPDVPVRQE
ncbi:MAG: hypothetical protein ABSF81_17960 [Bacteroidales bacterium]